MYDILIIGGGPAGISAALTARSRGKKAAVISGSLSDSPLWKAPVVDNYPGLPSVSGRALLELFEKQAATAGVERIFGRALSAMPMDESFGVSVGSEFYEAKTLILCTGVSQGNVYPGEQEFLGRGVSYCATCDGMLYRGKKVAVIGLCAEASEEAEFLRGIGCEVLYFDKNAKYRLKGTDKLEALIVDDSEYRVDGVFILRSTMSVDKLMPQLETENGSIKVDEAMLTNVPGIFAAGDSVGRPFQIAKAVGEGNRAALSASEYVEKQKKAD